MENQYQIEKRNIALCIVLSIITCGIYGLYWLYKLTEDVNALSGDPNATSGGMVILFTLLSCGIYSIYWCYKMGEKLDAARAEQGTPTGSLSILYLVLSIFGLDIVAWALMQNEVNHYTPGTGDAF